MTVDHKHREPPFGILPGRFWLCVWATVGIIAIYEGVTRFGFSTWIAHGVALINALVVGILVVRHIFRLRHRLRQSDGLLCPQCGYDLRALPEEGACPECGIRYEHAAVRKRWRWHHGTW